MLFGYPVVATMENWLHECLCQTVSSIHTLLAAGSPIPPWPGVLPAAFQKSLLSRHGVKSRLMSYVDAVRPLTMDQRVQIATAMVDQNNVASLLSGTSDCACIDDLPEAARGSIRSLFQFGFELLTDFGVRDRQYKCIHGALRYRVCPFCGCEFFDAPKSKREDFDHYLAESRYPFAASNLRNLAPMGHKCNSKYKLSADILRRADGTRRRAFDPYNAQVQQVSFEGSRINTELDGPLVAEWIVSFSSSGEEVDTWDQVFSIRDRYKHDVLDERTVKDWLRDFQSYCNRANHAIATDGDLLIALGSYQGFLSDLGFSDRAFLKAAAFRMFLERCHAGCARVLGVMRGLAGLPEPAFGL